MKKIKTIWICRAVVLLAGLLAAGAAGAEDWPQFQCTAARKGWTTDSAPVLRPVLKWRRYVDGCGVGIESPPVVWNDRVYVIACSTILALNAATGQEVWRADISGHGSLQSGTPAVGGGMLFVVTFDGYVMALDAAGGDLRWSRKVAALNFQCPLTYHQGRLYVGEGGTGGTLNRYFCLDAADGDTLWEYAAQTAGYLWCGASVAGDFLVFGNVNGVLTALHLADGTAADVLDFHDLGIEPGRIRASVSFFDGFVYTTSEAGAAAGYVYKVPFDTVSGTFGDPTWMTPFGFSTSTPVKYGDRIYVGQGEHGFPGRLVCLNDADGSILWDYAVYRGVKSSPALSATPAGLHIYFVPAQDDGAMTCLTENGNLAWSWNPPEDDGYILQGAALSEGRLFFGTGSGNLFCLVEAATADINGDGGVDVLDMIRLGQQWNQTGAPGWIAEDINTDGIVNILDMIIVGQNWSGRL